ncbi:MAG: hypothetical protein AMXMBFR33_34710 [Candidatus Xenobia bacterium]
MRLSVLTLTLAASVQLATAQMPGGPCGPCAPCGPAPAGPMGPQTIIVNPDGPMDRGMLDDSSDPDRPGYRGPAPEGPPVNPLDQRGAEDATLGQVLSQLNPNERQQLEQILQSYQNDMNAYIASHPRASDAIGVNGTIMNVIESFRSTTGIGTNERGCDPVSTAAGNMIAPLTGQPGSSWRVHEYEYVPNPDATVSGHLGRLVVAVGVPAVAGSLATGGPWGGIGGAVAGGAGWAITSFEHNMVVLVNNRDPNLTVVLDPHGAQSGNIDSVHGPGHYSGARIDAQYRPPTSTARP